MAIVGTGFSGQSQNNAMVFVKLKDWELRQRPDLKSDAVIGRAMGKFFTDPPIATPWSSPSRCRRSANWATPKASISS